MRLNQKQIKEYLANPEAFAAAAAPTAVEVVDGGAAAQAPPAEPEEESDDDMVSVPPHDPDPNSDPNPAFVLRAVPCCVPSAGKPVLTNVFSLCPTYNFHPSFSMGSNGTHSLDTPHRASISSAEQRSAPHLAFCVYLVIIMLLYLYPRSPRSARNIRTVANSARLHGPTLPGDHRQRIVSHATQWGEIAEVHGSQSG